MRAIWRSLHIAKFTFSRLCLILKSAVAANPLALLRAFIANEALEKHLLISQREAPHDIGLLVKIHIFTLWLMGYAISAIDV